jgi:uncharacterized membrane protein
VSLRLWKLAAVSVLAVVAMLSACVNWHPYAWLAVPGVLMALTLPGYALSMALLPGLESEERLLVSLGMSLVMDVLGGFVLYVSPWGLYPASWAAWLGSLTLASGFIAALRHPTAQPDTSQPWPRLDLKATLGFGLALMILVLALVTAQLAAQQKDLPFTQLWAVPVNDAEAYTLQLGINNQENRLMHYDLMVDSGGDRIEEWQRIALSPSQVWATRLSLSTLPAKPVDIRLYNLDRPGEVYRTVQIAPSSFPTPTVSLTGVR